MLITILDDSDFQSADELRAFFKIYPGEIDAGWIKVTEGLYWKSEIAAELAQVFIEENTEFGYYHYASGSDMSQQRGFFTNAIMPLPKSSLGHMLDYENSAAVAKGTIGIAHFAPDVCYADEDFWSGCNWGLDVPCAKWISQYFNDRHYSQSQADIYMHLGFAMWQFADYFEYAGKRWNQDISALLLPNLDPLKARTLG